MHQRADPSTTWRARQRFGGLRPRRGPTRGRRQRRRRRRTRRARALRDRHGQLRERRLPLLSLLSSSSSRASFTPSSTTWRCWRGPETGYLCRLHRAPYGWWNLPHIEGWSAAGVWGGNAPDAPPAALPSTASRCSSRSASLCLLFRHQWHDGPRRAEGQGRQTGQLCRWSSAACCGPRGRCNRGWRRPRMEHAEHGGRATWRRRGRPLRRNGRPRAGAAAAEAAGWRAAASQYQRRRRATRLSWRRSGRQITRRVWRERDPTSRTDPAIVEGRRWRWWAATGRAPCRNVA